jgi:putative ABC transport system permease protein
VTPDAPKAMGMRLLSGRFFDVHDNEKGQPVCLADETFVKENFGERDAVGKRIAQPGEEPKWLTIVGVVAHVKNYGVDQPSRPEVLLANSQRPGSGGAIVVRTTNDPFTVAGGLGAAVQAVDPTIPVYDVRTLVRGGGKHTFAEIVGGVDRVVCGTGAAACGRRNIWRDDILREPEES